MSAVKLVPITHYAKEWNIDRKTIYKLIDEGKLTRYEDPKGNPLLDINQRPKVQKYGKIRPKKVYDID